RRLLKELSEAYAMLLRVRRERGAASERPADGAGSVLFDVCSGKGVASLVLAYALPSARIVMVDSDEGMNLSYVRMRQNLSFHQLDVFKPRFEQLLASEAAGADWACVIGTHLCGALSPRLIGAYVGAGAVLDVLLLSPCCL
ncbi:hypothetical protein T492DRAFT_555482, partial [Pavlovales sp. CCMP2436]